MQGPNAITSRGAFMLWDTLIRPQWVKWHLFFGCTHPEGNTHCSWCMKGFPEEKQMQGDPPERQQGTLILSADEKQN